MEIQSLKGKRAEDSQEEVESAQESSNSGERQSNIQLYQRSDLEHERHLKPEEFQEVLNYARMLQKLELDREESDRKGLEALALFDAKKGIPISLVKQVIDEVMHVGRPYAQRALDILYPTQEQIERDLAEVGGKPTIEFIVRKYAQVITRSLRKMYPDMELNGNCCDYSEYHESYDFNIEAVTTISKKRLGLFTTKHKNKTKLVEGKLNLMCWRLNITFYDPRVLQAGKEQILKLNEEFLKTKLTEINVNYNYKID